MSDFDKTLNNSTDTATQTCGRHPLIFSSSAAAHLKSNASHYKDSNQPFPWDGKQLPAAVSGYSSSITSKISYLRQQEFQGCCSLPSAPRSIHINVWSHIKIEKIPILKDTLHSRSLRHNCMRHTLHKTLRTVFSTRLSANGSTQQIMLCNSSQRKMPKQKDKVEGKIFRLYPY